MAAKIRAMELLPDAVTDMEYLKLYVVVFLGWLLTGMGTTMFFGGFPPPFIVRNALAASVIGMVFGTVFWVAGVVLLLAGLVSLGRKVILETTRDELIDIDRLTGETPSTTEETTTATDEAVDESTLHAGARPSETPDSTTTNSRVDTPTGTGGETDASAGTDDGSSGDETEAETGSTDEDAESATE